MTNFNDHFDTHKEKMDAFDYAARFSDKDCLWLCDVVENCDYCKHIRLRIKYSKNTDLLFDV